MGQQLQCPVCGSLFIVPIVQPSVPMGWLPGQAPQQPQPPVPYWPPAGFQGTVPAPNLPGAAAGISGIQPSWPPAAQAGQLPFVSQQAPAGEPPLTAAPVIRTSSELPAPTASAPYAAHSPLGETAPAAAALQPSPTFQAGTAAQTGADAQAGSAAQTAPDAAGAGGGQPPHPAASPAEGPAKKEPRILHIPCPKGHELPTPEDMLNQEALCPYCRTQFRLLYKNSTEYKQERQRAEQERQARINRLAIKLSIWGAVIVVLFVIALVVLHYAK